MIWFFFTLASRPLSLLYYLRVRHVCCTGNCLGGNFPLLWPPFCQHHELGELSLLVGCFWRPTWGYEYFFVLHWHCSRGILSARLSSVYLAFLVLQICFVLDDATMASLKGWHRPFLTGNSSLYFKPYARPLIFCAALRTIFLSRGELSQWHSAPFCSQESDSSQYLSFSPLSNRGGDKTIWISENKLVIKLSGSIYIPFCHVVTLQSDVHPVDMGPRARCKI